MSSKNQKILIVGQGIVGSLLAWELLQYGEDVTVIDNHHHYSSSIVAGGDVNPITGQRFVKSWKIDELLAAMEIVYGDIARFFNIKIWHQRTIVRILQTVKQENDWLGRTVWPEWQGFIGNTLSISTYKPYFDNAQGVAEVLNGGRVDMPLILNTLKSYLLQEKRLSLRDFYYENLIIKDDLAVYEGVEYQKVVFCEGWQAVNNPFFNYLPFNPSKGEALIVRFTELYPFAHQSIKNDLMISYLCDDLYWVGATNKFNSLDPSATEQGAKELVYRLNEAINIPYTVVAHYAGLRPATTDRRPFLGQHKMIKPLFIFNGLGTKGASLAPYLTKQFANFLLENGSLENEVNIARFG